MSETPTMINKINEETIIFVKNFFGFVTKQSIAETAVGTLIGVYLSTMIGEISGSIQIKNSSEKKVYIIDTLGLEINLSRLSHLIISFMVMIVLIYVLFKLLPKEIVRNVQKINVKKKRENDNDNENIIGLPITQINSESTDQSTNF